ncbi:MAG: O-antigen ligase family protein [Luteolibacter sp.]
MMEGTYFFGEHLRWNLGWSNPNQAGAFVATLIPWLWGMEALIPRHQRGCQVFRGAVFAVELGLWFLLCKTYSRGAWVAMMPAILAACVWIGRSGSVKKAGGWLMMRIIGVGILTIATGFFERIDPGYVVKDASAGNRLTLWEGGLRMIAESPWQGWGADKSGREFMQWFQPVDAHEAYAGMVNSYLHLGVERGLLILWLIFTIGLGMVFLAFGNGLNNGTREDPASGNRLASAVTLAAGASWLVFAVANVFSTLWIFGNLWWVPAISGISIIGVAAGKGVRGFFRKGIAAFGVAGGLGAAAVLALWLAGKAMPSKIRVHRMEGGKFVSLSANRPTGATVLLLPDSTVLGEVWGKETRRFAEAFPDCRTIVPTGETEGYGGGVSFGGITPQIIIACGKQASGGISAWKRFPEARLILVHPLGKPDEMEERPNARVSVILPALDTRNTGRVWKMFSRKHQWPWKTSPDVAQDIRPLWPGILKEEIDLSGNPVLRHEAP